MLGMYNQSIVVKSTRQKMDFFVPKMLPHYCTVCTSYCILKKIFYLLSEAAASATSLCVLKFVKKCATRLFDQRFFSQNVKSFQ